jgi:aryl-alcohol dehydrogenase-like predicted oxidoreductase
MSSRPIDSSGTFSIGGDLEVHRLGYGAMQLTGKGIWGEPRDRDECLRVLRRAVELGVDFIDTADSYGPYVSEDLIREALHPYPDNLVIATKGGLVRTGPGEWHPVGRPMYLRQEVEMSLRRLGLERIDLYQLHRVDPQTPLEDSLGELAKLQAEGKIRHVGVSEVDVATLGQMRDVVDVVTVQNLFNLADQHHADVVDYCEQAGIGFIPWFPLATGKLAQPGGPLDTVAQQHGSSPSQLALAWLLRRSRVMLPIPGTSSVAHLEENCAAAEIALSDEEFAALSAAAG